MKLEYPLTIHDEEGLRQAWSAHCRSKAGRPSKKAAKIRAKKAAAARWKDHKKRKAEKK